MTLQPPLQSLIIMVRRKWKHLAFNHFLLVNIIQKPGAFDSGKKGFYSTKLINLIDQSSVKFPSLQKKTL